MKKNLLFLTLAVIALTSCKRTYQKAPDGMLYIKYTDNDGPKIKEGDFAGVNVIIKTDGDSLIDNTFEKGLPRLMIITKPIFKGDVIDALSLLTEGDSLSVKMPVDSVFKKAQKPTNFKGNFIIFDLKVEKVIHKGSMTDQQLRDKAITYLKNLIAVAKGKEPQKIKKYIADKKLNVTKTDSGLYYTINKHGQGPLAVAGDTAVFTYTSNLFNGKVFETSIREEAVKAKIFDQQQNYKPIGVAIGQHRIVPGWEQGLQLLNKGAVATFIIPSDLGYGDEGYGVVGACTPYVSKIELINIIPRSKAAPAVKK